MSEVTITDEITRATPEAFDLILETIKTEDTASHLEMYRLYADEELAKGNDILNFSEFRERMNS